MGFLNSVAGAQPQLGMMAGGLPADKSKSKPDLQTLLDRAKKLAAKQSRRFPPPTTTSPPPGPDDIGGLVKSMFQGSTYNR